MPSPDEELRVFADHVRRAKPSILARWRGAVAADPALKTAASLSRVRLDDHIPEILEELADHLLASPQAADQEVDRLHVGERHGAHRWQQGYALPEVAGEWKHMQLVLLEEVEDYARARNGVPAEALVVARRALTVLCTEAVERSISEYVRLQQSAAASRVRELESAVAQLQELQRQRSDIWRQAAHDLRDNVGLVSTATGVLNHPAVNETMRAQSLSTLEKGVTSLRELLTDLLSLARLEAGQEHRTLTTFDAGELLRTLCHNAAPLAAAHGLYLRAEGPTLQVEGDAVKVHRIAQNLLMNALKYTKTGGVTVRWGLRGTTPAQWFVSVSDTGPGVDLSAHSPIFHELRAITDEAPRESGKDQLPTSEQDRQPTDTAPLSNSHAPGLPNTSGEGVGLSIVKQLCELLDATLEMESKVGDGTVARVLLPMRYTESV